MAEINKITSYSQDVTVLTLYYESLMCNLFFRNEWYGSLIERILLVKGRHIIFCISPPLQLFLFAGNPSSSLCFAHAKRNPIQSLPDN